MALLKGTTNMCGILLMSYIDVPFLRLAAAFLRLVELSILPPDLFYSSTCESILQQKIHLHQHFVLSLHLHGNL